MGSSVFDNRHFVAGLFLFLLLSTGQVYGASFYGDGYVHLQTVGASIRTSLLVRFRTSSQSGLLFLAAGQRDFLLLELISGRLQVRLDLGSGERSLYSEKGVHLSDLAWHSMELTHDNYNVTMTVDRNSRTTLLMPGPDLELSVQDGLFVGGSAELDRPYLLPSSGYNSTGFRGCMDEVVFNEHNLLSSLRPYTRYKSVSEVSLGCSPQFVATEEDPVSFFSSKAFVLLPPWDVLQEGVFECELRPSARMGDGMVLYSSALRGGFVAIEIKDGYLVATVGNGEGSRTELRSLPRLRSDRTWHPIRLHLLPNSIQLKVGEELVDTSLGPELQVIQLEGPLYLGGLDERARGEARRAGLLLSVPEGQLAGGGGSFKGCIREIRVNTQRTGLIQASVTKDVSVGCTPGEASEAATASDTTNGPQFDATTEQPISNKDQDRKKSPNFLLLKVLEVSEGGRAPLEPRHIKVNLDFRKLGIHPSQLMFRIVEQPTQGQLRLDRDGARDEEEEERRRVTEAGEEEGWTFSMLDLWQGRVMYVHGGSEDRRDSFTFSVFSSSKKELPVFLKGSLLHRFDISIGSVNDAPELSLPEGNLFILLEKSKRRLSTDVLRVSDPDSNPAELVFSSLGNLNAEAGYLEHQDYPGRAISLFSLPDMVQGKISFVHTGVPTSRLALRVSDGQKLSNTVVLRIMAVAIEHKVVNNTGLEVDQGEASVITANHLAVQMNVASEGLEIRYEVMDAPRYGELQRLHSSGEWKPTSQFSQKLLDKERVRYLNTYRGLQTQSNITDPFRCKIIIGSVTTGEVVFSVTVRWIHFKVTRSRMEVNGVRRAVVSPEDLHAISKGVKLPESSIYFRLLTLPKKGNLLFNHKVLKRNSTFSQRNITDSLVKYELLNRPQEDMRDTFRFQVFSKHANSTGYDFRINVKAESTAVTLVNKGLSVLEGDSKVITEDMLFTHIANNKPVQYTITTGPSYGQIKRVNLSNSTSMNDNIVTFTNQDIVEERIMYVHDNSETQQDSFTFYTTVYKPHKHASKKEDKNPVERSFNISIQLTNDQRPVRVVDKVFRVARDGQRLLTLDDLRYRDDDSDFDDGRLLYTRRGIPMGELVLANDTNQKLYEFTQYDLEQRKVLFVHRGVSFGRFVLFVSDGKHYVSTLLEVMAQDPYLQVENNTGLLVQRGGLMTLTPTNLSVLTNLDIRDPREVTYEVFLPPKNGILFLDDGDSIMATDAASTFTQRDLVERRLAYRHDNSRELSDGFNVTARVRGRSPEGRVDTGRREVHLDIGVVVKVFLESHQRPPTVLTNIPVVVDEGQNVSISRANLEVVHRDSQPSEIVFSVQSPPSLGFVRRTSSGEERREQQDDQLYQGIREQPITSFTQEDLNLGLVFYQHQDPTRTNDSLLLGVTNGVTEVGPIRVEFDIIPILLPLQTSDAILDEGSSLPLTSDIIKVTNHHFAGMNFLYQVIVPPRHGHLEHSRIPGMPITAFTHTEVEREYISYIHDGSDTLIDNFTIVANQTEISKHSLPSTVYIIISPVNDETPVIISNRELKVWVGSVTEITLDDLSAEDLDTEPEGLEFIVTPPSNGHLALKSAPSRHILNFTQRHIQTGQLVFTHNGALSGGFHFQVNDGVNFAPRQIFSTAARSLLLTLQTNQPMEVYPGSVTPICARELQVVTNGDSDIRGNHSTVFAVTTAPKLGRLVKRLPDNSTQQISAFTQSMLNDGVILYDQNQPESVGWSAKDSFTFTVSSPPAFLPPNIFIIFITYQANAHQHNDQRPQRRTKLQVNTGAVVAEGGRVVIDKSRLDASNLLGKVPEPERQAHQVWYRVISLPRYGTLSVGGQNLTRDQLDFSQLTLDKFGISYIHDDSETTSDSFAFRAWVAPLDTSSSTSSSSLSTSSSTPVTSVSSSSSSSPSSSDVARDRSVEDRLVVTELFNITVTPVNDQPPLIRTRAPSMKVVMGERVVLGPENLQVEDHDTPPEELHYSVISKPNNGYLTLGERPEPVTSFTQYDVNHGRLHFVQQGEPSTGVFYFNVTDGYHGPLYKLFSLEVTKAAVSIANNTGLSLVQGRTAVVLSTNQLAAQTNGRSSANITYTVTTLPRHGRIAINDQEVTTFRHEDLQFGRVVYHMTDLSESEDSFKVSVSASSPGVVYGNLTGQKVNVTVRPLIYLREPVRVPSGIAVKLGKAMMDASELARISRTDPVFEVLSPPKHGKLVKVTYDLDQASEVLRSFTFRDVVQGRVAIEETLSNNSTDQLLNKSTLATARGHTPATPLNDSFVFLLKAGHIQPAKGELHFTILPHHQMHHGPGGSNKAESPGRKQATTRLPGHNKTTTGGGKGGGRGASAAVSVGMHPHILSHKNHNRTLNKLKPHSRWANHTRGRGDEGKPGGGARGDGGENRPSSEADTPSVQVKRGPADAPNSHPVQVEVLPRPASDPLLIIMPLLTCLLLIVILVVLILVFRHRSEKRARMRLFQELAAVSLPTECSPFLGRQERSVAMPSVIVTQLGPSCPNSPMPPRSPRRRSQNQTVTFWCPLEANGGGGGSGHGEDGDGGDGDEGGQGGNAGRCKGIPVIIAGSRSSLRPKSPTPTLKGDQYWV
ncbi:chondroitin sulfate proteoglycan 4-like [Polymixia lowei]